MCRNGYFQIVKDSLEGRGEIFMETLHSSQAESSIYTGTNKRTKLNKNYPQNVNTDDAHSRMMS